LEQIKAKISATEDKLKIAERKLAEAEGTGDNAKIAKHEAKVEILQLLLTEQQKKENLLLAGTGNVIHYLLHLDHSNFSLSIHLSLRFLGSFLGSCWYDLFGVCPLLILVF